MLIGRDGDDWRVVRICIIGWLGEWKGILENELQRLASAGDVRDGTKDGGILPGGNCSRPIGREKQPMGENEGEY